VTAKERGDAGESGGGAKVQGCLLWQHGEFMRAKHRTFASGKVLEKFRGLVEDVSRLSRISIFRGFPITQINTI
jgi:hypothetical protein